MHATSTSELPLPAPRWLSAAEAAGYVGVDVAEFRSEVEGGLWPAAGRKSPSRGDLWDRIALDRASDHLSGLSVPLSHNAPRAEPAELLNAKQAAELAGCSLDTIKRASAAELPRHGRGRTRLFKRDDVVAFATSKPAREPELDDLDHIIETYQKKR